MLANIEQAYQLSPMQKDLLAQIDALHEPAAPVIHVRCTFSGDLNIANFELAWRQVVARHAMLRTSFWYLQRIEPLQLVHSQVQLNMLSTDLRARTADAVEAAISDYCEADLLCGFDVQSAPLMRLMLFRQPDNVFLLVWSLHPLLLDKIAQMHVLDDVFTYYDVLCQGYEPLLHVSQSYQHYVARIQQQQREPIEQFWREHLAGATPTTLASPHRARREAEPCGTYAWQQIELPATTSAALYAFTREHHVSFAALCHGAWALLLSRYTATNDPLFGTTLTQHSALASIVGLCAATVPLRLATPPSAVLWTWLRNVDDQLVAVRQHRYTTLDQLRRWHGQDTPALFESAVLCDKTYVDPSTMPWCKNLDLRDISANRTLTCPLTLIVEQRAEISLELAYESSRFHERLITDLFKDLLLVLQQIAADPYQRVAEIVLYHESPRLQVLAA